MAEQRLPNVGSDDGTWGGILREYLMKEHYNGDSNVTPGTSTNGGHQFVTIRPGTTSAAPLTLTAGTNLTTPAAGSVEYDGTYYYLTTSSATRMQIVTDTAAQTLTNKTIDGSSNNTFANIPQSAVTNLAADLAAKATDSAVVHKSGTETITGNKTFTGDVQMQQQGTTFDLVNVQTSQYSNAGFMLYSNASSFGTNAAGVQLVSGISDVGGTQAYAELATVDRTGTFKNALVQWFLWDSTTKLLGLLDMDSHKITNLANPTNAQDAATKNYVDTNAVTPSGSQVLTNKDLTSGTNTFPVFPIANGGTGQSTQQAAINALTGTQSAGKYLRSDGTNATLTSIQAGDVPVLNQNTTGSAATLTTSRTFQTNLASTTAVGFNGSANNVHGVTGTLPVANGGTGATTLTGILKGNGTGAVTAVTAPSGTIVGTTDSQTLENKRINPRVVSPSITSSYTINVDVTDLYDISGQSSNVTFNNPSGTPVNGQKMMIRIKDNGTARTITWGSSFQSSGVAALLATTVVNREHHVLLVYSPGVSKWVCLAADATGY